MSPWSLSLVLLSTACAAPPGAAGAPWGPRTLITDRGHFTVDLELGPDPPVAGATALRVWTEDASGVGVSPSLTLTPWMPAHGHGVSEAPVFEPMGDGGAVARFAWSMPGAWELRLGVSHGGLDDAVVVAVEVQ